MKNEEVVDAIQEYHEKRIQKLEGHVETLNREMGQVLAAVEANKFWLKVIGIGTPATVMALWILDRWA